MANGQVTCKASDECVFAYFMHLKRIEDDVGDANTFLQKQIIFVNFTKKRLKKYLKFVKKFLRRSPKSMKGSQIHLSDILLGLKNYQKS
jgi:hypothetical protein